LFATIKYHIEIKDPLVQTPLFSYLKNTIYYMGTKVKQAGAELCQAQVKLGLAEIEG
jgi:hypothetical protein